MTDRQNVDECMCVSVARMNSVPVETDRSHCSIHGPTSTTQPEVAPASKSSSFPPSSYPEEGETGVFSEDASASVTEVGQ